MSSIVAEALIWLGVAAAAPAEPVDLNSLTGSWIMEENDRTIREEWTTPSNGEIRGTSISGTGSKANPDETMRIGFDREGVLTFWAQPRGAREPTPFRLASTAYHQLMFENLENDYPQRIIYFRDGGWLFANIMQKDGSRDRSFVYRPAKPPRARPGGPMPTANHVESAVTFSRRCVDEDGYTNCLPPTSTHIRNLICWPKTDLAGYVEPYRTSPAAECSFESIAMPMDARPGNESRGRWRADWARLHYIETNDCTPRGCKRDWVLPRD